MNALIQADMSPGAPLASAYWHPVLPSAELARARNIVLGFVAREELALWRAEDDTAQAWVNRCPHRGTRLTLGRIVNGHLACAYHGWEFAANDGRCVKIPAHPQMAAPRNVCAKTFQVAEVNGMIWASRDAQPGPPPHVESGWFLRTVALRATTDAVARTLASAGWKCLAPDVWRGFLGALPTTIFLTDASDALSLAHVALDQQPEARDAKAAHAALRRLRESAESGWSCPGAPE